MANSIIKRVGGKNKISQWIKNNLPIHSIYCEGFAGSYAVGFAMPYPSGTKYRKVLNDLDGHLCNFFEVLRDSPEDFSRAINQSPYSRKDFDESRDYILSGIDFNSEDKVEWARRFVIYNRQSIFGKETDTWCIARKGENVAYTWGTLPKDIINVSRSLKGVFIENLDYIDLVKKWDNEKTLFYMDPPYLNVEKDFYEVNKKEGFDHEELANQMLAIEGSFAVSYYDSEEIRNMYPGCEFITKEVVKHMQTGTKDKASELLIIRENDYSKKARKRFNIEF